MTAETQGSETSATPAATWEPVICDECGQPFDGIGPEPYEACPKCWADGVMGDV